MSMRSGVSPSSATACAAITFVLPGLEPMPSSASSPARSNSSDSASWSPVIQ